MENSGRLDRGDGVELAWARIEGRGPTVVFMPGFSSDMAGSKALDLGSRTAASDAGPRMRWRRSTG